MTDCPSVIRLIYPYLDHEIDPAERDQVEAHLVRCPECRGRYAAESQFRTLLTNYLGTPPVSSTSVPRTAIEVQLRLPLTESETTS